LTPVIREGEPEPTPAPELYAAWKILVFTEDGRREITRIDINSAGDYQMLLPAGTYLVRAKETNNGGGIGSQQDYYVEIVEGRTTQLDVDIDTGIR